MALRWAARCDPMSRECAGRRSPGGPRADANSGRYASAHLGESDGAVRGGVRSSSYLTGYAPIGDIQRKFRGTA